MKTSDNLTALGARIKLFKRHLWEWNGLLVHQREVRRLTRDEMSRQAPIKRDAKITLIERMTDQASRLAQLSMRQLEDRQQMKARHQQDEIELEQAFDSPK